MARLDRLGQMVHGEDDEAAAATGDAAEKQFRSTTDRLRDPQVQSSIFAQPDKNRLVGDLVFTHDEDDTGKNPRWKAGDQWTKRIYVPLELRQQQIEKRRILDGIEAFMKALMMELSQFTDDGQRPSEEWMNRNEGYIDVAMAVPRVRNLARQLMVSVAYEMRDPPQGSPETQAPTRVAITVADLGEGLHPLHLFALTMTFCRRVSADMEARKNGLSATGQQSGQPSSERPSSTTTRGLRRRRSSN